MLDCFHLFLTAVTKYLTNNCLQEGSALPTVLQDVTVSSGKLADCIHCGVGRLCPWCCGMALWWWWICLWWPVGWASLSMVVSEWLCPWSGSLHTGHLGRMVRKQKDGENPQMTASVTHLSRPATTIPQRAPPSVGQGFKDMSPQRDTASQNICQMSQSG